MSGRLTRIPVLSFNVLYPVTSAGAVFCIRSRSIGTRGRPEREFPGHKSRVSFLVSGAFRTSLLRLLRRPDWFAWLPHNPAGSAMARHKRMLSGHLGGDPARAGGAIRRRAPRAFPGYSCMLKRRRRVVGCARVGSRGCIGRSSSRPIPSALLCRSGRFHRRVATSYGRWASLTRMGRRWCLRW